LITKKATVALNELYKKTLYLVLKIGRSQIYTAPRRKIDRAEIEPYFLAFLTVNRAHL
jgi:hypothetical protein